MAVDISQRVCNGHLLKWLASAGMTWLEHNREKVDKLNVFPVPDGDTGKNMVLTMRRAYQEIADMDEGHVGIVSQALAHGALMGARGNSGVILSQLWQGFAQAVRGYEAFDAPLFALACTAAVDLAYKAVKPVEGTILTVARESVEAVVSHAPHESDMRILLEIMVEAAQESLKRTPDLLPVLKKAGVVDSGGQGLVYLLEGMLYFLRGDSVIEPGSALNLETNETWQDALEPEDEEGYGYDVQFLMHGRDMDVKAVREAIDNMGWSTLVVGDDQLIKVHVHVHNPGEPISYAIKLGVEIDDVVVENMQRQYQQYVENRLAQEGDHQPVMNEVSVIAVASGDGLRRLFEQDLQAAHVISGGQTMNPSTQDFLAAIDSLHSKKIILLPNNKNIILAAEQAASLARDKDVRVVPSKSLPQGISAMLEYTNVVHLEDIEEIATVMTDALEFVTGCEVTIANRDAEFDGVRVREGQYIGLVDGQLVSAGDDLVALIQDVLRKAGADERERITLYYGDGVKEAQAQAIVDKLSAEYLKQQFEIVRGSQPLYPYIISVE
jgi:DAK2 domain fusion protein YloV